MVYGPIHLLLLFGGERRLVDSGGEYGSVRVKWNQLLYALSETSEERNRYVPEHWPTSGFTSGFMKRTAEAYRAVKQPLGYHALSSPFLLDVTTI